MNTLRPLTPRQKDVLEFVGRFVGQRGFAPSLREIGRGVGLANINAVRGHVAALQRKGYIRQDPDTARSIRLAPQAPSLVSRLKRRLHRAARTDEGVLHHVVYGLVLAAGPACPDAFAPPIVAAAVEEALARLEAEHGWRLERRTVAPGHIVLTAEVWPNHSPELAVRRVRAAVEAGLRRRRLPVPPKLWARGFAATTDLGQLDELEKQFLEERR